MKSLVGISITSSPKSGFFLNYKSQTIPRLLGGSQANYRTSHMVSQDAEKSFVYVLELPNALDEMFSKNTNLQWLGQCPSPTTHDLSFMSIPDAERGIAISIPGFFTAPAIRSWFLTFLKPTVLAVCKNLSDSNVNLTLEVISDEA